LKNVTVSRYSFDYHDDEVYWCTADIGWITGHSYIVYGPMANGATSVMVNISDIDLFIFRKIEMKNITL